MLAGFISDQLNNLVSSCGQISGIADGVAAVLQNTNMLLNKQMKPKSCQELLANGATDSGVYSIYLNENETPIKVCILANILSSTANATLH